MKTERPKGPSEQPETTPRPAKDDFPSRRRKPEPDREAIAEVGDAVGGPA
jgi:hypothetical protein